MFEMKSHGEAIDIAIPNGTAVYATHKGKVISESTYGNGGNAIKILGNCNGVSFYSYYAHLDRFLVDIGKEVDATTQIALSDNTGHTTGPHLHYAFYGLKMDYQNFIER
jgi:murein DD-endopeptidase MepM/ murein hydrolase activator NlpD